MAYDKNGSSNNNGNNGIPANKKAIGYLNLYLPNKSGGRRKVGTGLPLREMFQNERQLAEWFAVDPIERAKIFLSQLQVEYNASTPAEESAFDLPE